MEVFELSLNKTVKVANLRLRLVYLVLLTIFIFLIVWKFVYLSEHTKAVPLDLMRSWLWVPSLRSADLKRAHARSAGTSICSGSSSYGGTQLPCMPPCPQDSGMCVHQTDLYTIESANQLLLHTRIEEWEELVAYNKTTRNKKMEYLTPSSDAFEFAFAYAFQDPNGLTRSSLKDVRTIIEKGNQRWRIIEPAGAILLQLPEIFELAESPDALNFKRTATNGRTVTTRYTGIEVQLLITCDDINLARPECVLKVDVTPQDFAFKNARDRTCHGVRMQILIKGNFLEASPSQVYAALVAAIVILRLPKKLIHIFATTSIGHMATIYSKVLKESFDLSKQVGGMAVRMMTNNVIYVELCDDPSHGISKQTMRQRMHQIFNESRQRHETQNELDMFEIDDFTNFCYASVLGTGVDPASIRNALRELSTGALSTRFDSESSLGPINATRFNIACSSNDRVSFPDVVSLFDADRKRSCLEIFFTPKDVRKFLGKKRKERSRFRKECGSPSQVSIPSSGTSSIKLSKSSSSDIDTGLEALTQRSTRRLAEGINVLKLKSETKDAELKEYVEAFRALENKVQESLKHLKNQMDDTEATVQRILEEQVRVTETSKVDYKGDQTSDKVKESLVRLENMVLETEATVARSVESKQIPQEVRESLAHLENRVLEAETTIARFSDNSQIPQEVDKQFLKIQARLDSAERDLARICQGHHTHDKVAFDDMKSISTRLRHVESHQLEVSDAMRLELHNLACRLRFLETLTESTPSEMHEPKDEADNADVSMLAIRVKQLEKLIDSLPIDKDVQKEKWEKPHPLRSLIDAPELAKGSQPDQASEAGAVFQHPPPPGDFCIAPRKKADKPKALENIVSLDDKEIMQTCCHSGRSKGTPRSNSLGALARHAKWFKCRSCQH